MNERIMNLKTSASMMLTIKAEQMKKNGEDVLIMTAGEPDFDTPSRISEAASESLRQGHTHYASGRGILPLREKIAEKLKTCNGIPCTPDNIVVTPGGKFAIYLAVNTLINPGDEVIVFTPAWVSYIPIVEACGGRAVSVPLSFDNNFCLEKNVIEQYITDKTKAMIINYPNNPTGKILSEEEAQMLAELALKYDFYIISDEIYDEIVYDNKKSVSIGAIPEVADKVITINGFSKSFAMTGWRLGYLAASMEIIPVMSKLYSHTVTCTPTFIQQAAVVAFDCMDEVHAMSVEYEQRRDYFVNELNKLPGIFCLMPEGAFYVWIKFDTDKTSSEVADWLLTETGIVCVPGESYGETNGAFVRFSFACKMDVLKEVIRRMKGLLEKENV